MFSPRMLGTVARLRAGADRRAHQGCPASRAPARSQRRQYRPASSSPHCWNGPRRGGAVTGCLQLRRQIARCNRLPPSPRPCADARRVAAHAGAPSSVSTCSPAPTARAHRSRVALDGTPAAAPALLLTPAIPSLPAFDADSLNCGNRGFAGGQASKWGNMNSRETEA